MNTTSNDYYKVGGSLDRDTPSYGVRQADEDFYQALKAGEFCYVLNSRQMGKSSLRVRTVARLEAEGIACSQIDITSIGSRGITASEWYWGVVRRLARSFRTSVNLKTWWQERAEASPVDRLSQFVEEVLLVEVKSAIVIFMDEIDSILNLDFKDDFFALIRTCYNQRAENLAYRRLTFALLGVATPSDLIQDKSRTPFNIGRSIDLRGLQLHEAKPLAQGLQGKAEDAIAVLRAILDWTGGQPFLTQKVCLLLQTEADRISAGQEAEQVRLLVQSRLIENWEGQDEPEHLRTIQNRLVRDDERKRQLLGLYQQVLQQGAIPATVSQEQIQLRLSGLVVEDQGRLRSHNRIYATVFNQGWVERILAELRPYNEAFLVWLSSNREDKSRLLRGQALIDALDWAEGKLLAPDDNQFLAQSQRLQAQELELQLGQEIKEKEAILRSRAFKFGTKEAASIAALIELCDQYVDEAEKYLFDGSFQTWLLGNLGEAVLAQSTKRIMTSYRKGDTRKGLELFVRELCKRVGMPAYPQISLEPSTIEFHNLMVGEKRTIVLRFKNQGRGFVWGKVESVGNMPGLSLSSQQFNSSNFLTVLLDTIDLEPGEYQGRIVCIPNEIPSTYYNVPIYYTIQDFQIHPEFDEKYLGTFLQEQEAIPVNLELGLISAQKVKIEVTTTDFLLVRFLEVIGNKQFSHKLNVVCEQDRLKICVVPNVKQTKAVGLYQEILFLKIGSKQLSIPLKFRISYNYKKIIGKWIIVGFIVALSMWITRLFLNHFFQGWYLNVSVSLASSYVEGLTVYFILILLFLLGLAYSTISAHRKRIITEKLSWLNTTIHEFIVGENTLDDYYDEPVITMEKIYIVLRGLIVILLIISIGLLTYLAIQFTLNILLLLISLPISAVDRVAFQIGRLAGIKDPAIAWCLIGFLLPSTCSLVRFWWEQIWLLKSQIQRRNE